MKSEISIALIQSDVAWENIQDNLAHFSALIKNIQADIIVLPEMFSTGFTMNTRLSEPVEGLTYQWMNAIAKTSGSIICGSVITEDQDHFYNRFHWVSPQGKNYHYNKAHLFSLAGEDKYYHSDKERLIITWEGWKIAPFVCYDLRFPVFLRRTEAFDYDLAIFVASWPERRSHAWKSLLIARAIENQSYVAGVNRIGNDGNEIPHSGDSMIIDPSGKLLASGKPFKTEVVQTTLSKDDLEFHRRAFPFFNDRDDFTINH